MDKLPPADEEGRIHLEGHWWRRDRDEIALVVAKLGTDLQKIQSGLDRAKDADDLTAIRGRCLEALVAMQEAMLPIFGADRLWPISVAVDALEFAASKKRHWLTSLPEDELHVRRDAPDRMIVQCLVAAALHFLSQRCGYQQGQVASDLSTALAKAGYLIRSKGERHPPRPRTIQEWRSQCLPGSRKKPIHPKMREMFEDFVKQFENGIRGRSMSEYYEVVLNEVIVHARDRREFGLS